MEPAHRLSMQRPNGVVKKRYLEHLIAFESKEKKWVTVMKQVGGWMGGLWLVPENG